ncbi:MAG: hypothetical protein ACP5II_05305 [Infirmifilum sp.]|jgi:ribosome biogenesis SPOUT family RNA methylase Rps3|uniref:hypothetical protein n=1 Tax=Infirmifilum TaxID=2856573 RepID=UPI003C737F5F
MRPPIFTVEVVEPFISKWMFIELSHASKIVGRESLWVFNVKKECEREKLFSIASRVESQSFLDKLEELKRDFNIIILDPSGTEELRPTDFSSNTIIVVGGIMGDHPPRGRTRKEISERAGGGVLFRNIGSGQFTIDGAIYMARMVSLGRPLNSIPVQVGLTLKKRHFEVYLPYAYPVENGKVVISQEEIHYILHELEEDEARALREGKHPSICD